MPFKSKAQVRKMFMDEPKVAKKWAKKYGFPKDLPEKKSSKTDKKAGYEKEMYERRKNIGA